MAEKRMFTVKIVESDAFLDLPLTAQALYLHLNMNADDDGFVNNAKMITRLIGASQSDLQSLIDKAFILLFPSGVIVVKGWLMNNIIKADRKKPTSYQEELSMLKVKDNRSYTWKQKGNDLETKRKQNGNDLGHSIDQFSLDKTRLDKTSNNTNVLFAPHDETSDAIYSLKLKEKNLSQPVYREDIDLLQSLYPDINVEQEIRNMVGWCMGNPTQRKTQSGIKAFITRWLNKEQNKIGKVPDAVKDQARLAYIKDVEMKAERQKKGDEIYYEPE